MSTTPKSLPALLLTVGGAADTWHTVDGLPGHYHPSEPVPLDGSIAGLTEPVARAFIAAHTSRVTTARTAWDAMRADQVARDLPDMGAFAAPSCPVKLVTTSPSAAALVRDQLTSLAGAAVEAVKAARRAGEGEVPNVKAQAAALTTEEG